MVVVESSNGEVVIGEMEIVGATAEVRERNGKTARLCIGEKEISRNSAAGVYGLVWIPATKVDCPLYD